MSNNDIHFEATIFTNTLAPSTSSNYNTSRFTHICIIAKITSGQLDIRVSNDGNNFVTYELLTTDGYSEFNGFRFVQLVASSGTIISAVLVAKRRYSVLPIEIKASKDMFRYRRVDKIGWGKGDI